VPRAERRRRAEAALERVGLGDRMHHQPNELSGGQQQRVSIARALVQEPVMLLADEPTGALDSETTVQIMDLFSELHEAGMTVILVTHEGSVAEYARRVLRVRDGPASSRTSGKTGRPQTNSHRRRDVERPRGWCFLSALSGEASWAPCRDRW
jgi:putative ABC transport system ATP-binding protein